MTDLPTIAPAPLDHKPLPQRTMGYSCQPCGRRKVKCDKAAPTCAACRKTGAACVYEAPPPRGGKRLVTRDVLDRLARYERLLKEHGLLDAAGAEASGESAAPKDDPISIHWNASGGQESGAVIAGEGRSRYVDGSFWRNIGVGKDQLASDEDEEGGELGVTHMRALAVSDPLSDALLGTRQALGLYHPTEEAAMVMWQTYAENIEPITKMLHVPSTRIAMEQIARDPQLAKHRDECLAFSIYHFAVFSMTDEECAEKLGQSRTELLSSFHFATRQALVNASFLKTTDVTVLQSLVLFLLPSRYTYDAHTHWILTGAAVRIGQRIGLHRDGAKLGLAPFDTEVRRRLFYPLLSLDGIASQMAGTAVTQLPETWDVRQPLNINDDQIWPGMTDAPVEQSGATDMMFRLSRTCIGQAFAKTGKTHRGGVGGHFDEAAQAEQAIREAERDVEEKYLRYCDVVNPLHFLSMALARSGILAMRLRVYLSKMRNKTATDEDKRQTLPLALRILDTDHAVCTHGGMSKFRWHTQSFFLWGMWDALTFVLNGLWKEPAVFSAADVESAWTRMLQVYHNHAEMLDSKQTIHVAFRKLTLVAWDAHHQCDGGQGAEPAFVVVLRAQQERKRRRRAAQEAAMSTADGALDADMLSWQSGASLSESPLDFNIDDADWSFWDGLLHGGMQ
ncbi:C6 transcription [Cordyceps militaris]|uniref:C6 transcription n=1 Tax=Cordyceps militaris TaxID=73501 RepID=A0A2H4SJ27_CORMI|nr:C6 transcription [Cordyceps militaris]